MTKAMNRMVWLLCAAGLMALNASAQEVDGGASVEFDELCAAIQRKGDAVTDADVVKALRLGNELGRPYAVAIATKAYIARQRDPSPELAQMAIDNAFRIGDLRTAVGRCKTYLSDGTPDPASSDIAARMYAAQIDFLGASGDAYRFMTAAGQKFRQSAAAKKFDAWYLMQAQDQKLYGDCAKRLAMVLGDQMPIEQERIRYWPWVEWLMGEIRTPDAKKFEAAADCRKVASLLRGDAVRKTRYAFYAENLAFNAAAKGKAKPQLEKDFAAVTAAAQAYLGASSTSETLKDIITVFAEGDIDRGYKNQGDAKRKFFADNFLKLPATDRNAMLEWKTNRQMAPYMASREQWKALATADAAFFQGADGTRFVPFVVGTKDAAAIAQQAAVLGGVPSVDAAVINALAKGASLKGCGEHLVKNESWHMDGMGHPYWVFKNNVWPAYAEMKGGEKRLPDSDFEKEMLSFGLEQIAKTPMAFDANAAREYIHYAWRQCGNDKGAMIAHLTALDWVPYDERDGGRYGRRMIFEQPQRDFRGWSDHVRREYNSKKRDSDNARKKGGTPSKELEEQVRHYEKQAGQITVIEEAFKRALDPATGDPEKAPNALCKNLALAAKAVQARKSEDFMLVARRVYPMVRDYSTKKMPFGRSIMTYLLKPSENMDVSSFQADVMAEYLAKWKKGGNERETQEIMDAIMTSRRHWNWNHIPKNDTAMANKLNAVIEKEIQGRLKDKGNVDRTLFEWLKTTRRGSGWHDRGRNVALFETMVKERKLPAIELMANACHEFALPRQYTTESYFDDMFIKEAKEQSYLDVRYWHYRGQDRERKVRNAAAEIIASYGAVPLGNIPGPAYSQADFWRWQTMALEADAKPRNAMLDKVESLYGTTRFDGVAMGREYFRYQADVKSGGGRKAFFEKLDAYLERAASVRERTTPPSMARLAEIDPASLTEAELATLTKVFDYRRRPATWARGHYFELLIDRVGKGLMAKKKQKDLFALAPHFWKVALDSHDQNVMRGVVELCKEALKNEQWELAAILTSVGQDVAGGKLTDVDKSAIARVRSLSMTKFQGVIPVPPSDPTYPIYMSQADYLTGSEERAWKHYASASDKVLGIFKDLDPTYCTWLINRNSEGGAFEAASALARAMIQYTDDSPDAFSQEGRLDVMLAYANIAYSQSEYPRAKALYGQIATAKEFENMRGQIDAELRTAEIERVTGQKGEAQARLEKLLKRQNRYIQTEGHYHLALVNVDQEDYSAARDNLERVFSLSPAHAEGRILEGKINLAIKQLERATRVDKVGLTAEQEKMVPGKILRVSVEDRTLSVVGRTQDIEVEAWTESGDREKFILRPFADSQTRFEGGIPTELAPIEQGDDVLQVLGKDKVYYDFSAKFKKDHKIEEETQHSLTTVSDSEMFASSGRIVSREEQEEAQLEQMIKQKLEIREEVKDGPGVALSEVRQGAQVKPGNKINIRVLDPDRSETAEADTITVAVKASSGDTIPAFPLTETETHSGVFEAAIPTEPAPAVAYASDSEEGSIPNYAISSGDHPAWVARPDARKPKTFTVDLNDNTPFGTLKVTAAEPGRKIKDFSLQISRNGMDFRTIGGWPVGYKRWDGKPRAVVVKAPPVAGGGQRRRGGAQSGPPPEEEMIENKALSQRKMVTLPGVNAEWGNDVFGQAGVLGLGGEAEYVVRITGAFFVPKRRLRTFRLVPKTAPDAYQFYVDGQMIPGPKPTRPGDEDKPEDPPPFTYSGALRKGVHRFDIYVTATTADSPGFQVLCDTNEAPYMVPCPADMFDPERHPEILLGLDEGAADVAPEPDESVFNITFTEGMRGRALRLIMHDFETDAPAINKVALSAADGTEVLPTKADLMALRRNQVLEIIPGDQVSIAYKDPRGVERDGIVHEQFLSATYADGGIDAGLVVGYEEDNTGMRRPVLAKLYRYEPGDTIDITVRDPDEDISEEPDSVIFEAKTFGADPIRLKVRETGPHTGVFMGRIFPVEHDPKRGGELKIVEGDDIQVAYMDRENIEPGVPWERTALIERNWYQDPEVRAYDVISQALPPPGEGQGAQRPGARPAAKDDDEVAEVVEPMFELIATRPDAPEPEGPTKAVIGGPVLVELFWPTIARSSVSKATLYAQTKSGREKKLAEGEELQDVPEGTYDINVPGTIKLVSGLGGGVSYSLPVGYSRCTIVGGTAAAEIGNFMFSLPMAPGEVASESLVEVELDEETGKPPTLKIRGDDEIYVGFEYVDEQGKTNWLTRTVQLLPAGMLFDVMDKEYAEKIEALHVGKTAYYRVINPAADMSEERDKVTIALESTSGHKKDLDLMETFPHSGIFKGLVTFEYATEEITTNNFGVLPVTYGATVVAKYAPRTDVDALEQSITIHKGSDGDITPFSKRFKDPSIAVRTQLAIAEAYFELAKQHRRLKQTELSKSEIAEGKRVMEEAVSDYPDTETRAQADYLLANLAFEFAEDAQDPETKRQHYREAVVRFRDIVSTHGDTTYAPRAQYKKALSLEKLGEFDVACEEYVKLSYRWPENELIAETIARLGQYFYRKGRALTQKYKAIENPVEQEKGMMQAREHFRTSAEVFGRLIVKFPSHALAQKTAVLSGQCYMRADELPKAIDAFKIVVDNKDAEKDIRAEAMYWAGDSHTKLETPEDIIEAYRMFKKLTWDYPATKWAKYARGRLAEQQFARVDDDA